jgi:glycosyltransferase involved in cell wall biosynthesis
MTVEIIIPCLNEEKTITKVIRDFQRELPDAQITVVDNNCTDRTGFLALEAGAKVLFCPQPGKGAAVRLALRSCHADVVILVDGDDTYPAEAAPDMLTELQMGQSMVVADRISKGHYSQENKRPFHELGNTIVRLAINNLFNTQVKDVMSGYRAMKREFYKSFAILLDGFEIETAMTIHAVDRHLPFTEIPVAYRDRPPGSESKLNTVKDGINVLRSILWLFKDAKPLAFFGGTAAGLAIATLLMVFFAAPLTWGAAFLMLLLSLGAGLSLCVGLILDTSVKHQRELFEIHLLNFKKEPNL